MRLPVASPKAPPAPPVEQDVVEIEDVDAIDVSALMARLRALFTQKGYQPPLAPSAALRLLELTRRAEVDPNRAAAVFADDPLLAARVLQIARSPLYGGVQVPTIKDAIVRLGARKLHDVVLEAAMDMRVFKSAQYQPWMESIRRHSLAVAHAARTIATQVGADPDQSFFAGLVHDIGSAVLLGAIGGRAKEFADLSRGAIALAMDDLHTEVGGLVVDTWRMPREIAGVVSFHHHIRLPHNDYPLLAVVVLAESCALGAGFDVVAEPDGPVMDPLDEEDVVWAMRALAIDDATYRRIEATLTPMFDLLATRV